MNEQDMINPSGSFFRDLISGGFRSWGYDIYYRLETDSGKMKVLDVLSQLLDAQVKGHPKLSQRFIDWPVMPLERSKFIETISEVFTYPESAIKLFYVCMDVETPQIRNKLKAIDDYIDRAYREVKSLSTDMPRFAADQLINMGKLNLNIDLQLQDKFTTIANDIRERNKDAEKYQTYQLIQTICEDEGPSIVIIRLLKVIYDHRVSLEVKQIAGVYASLNVIKKEEPFWSKAVCLGVLEQIRGQYGEYEGIIRRNLKVK